MSMVTYPLNNIEYTAEDAELFHSTRTSGVYATNSFDYSVTGADNTIIIRTGIAWIKNSEFSGKVVAQKESISLDMGLPDSVYPRIDAIVIQFDANKNASEILVKEGVASSNPTPPNVVRTESIYELHIYHVRRYAGSLTISPDSISDLRTNSNYCGLMYDSVTQAVDATLSKSGIAADAEAVGKRISNLKAEDVGAASADSVGTNKVFKKLTDIGITTFPTTMATVASKMPNNSTLIIDSRDIVSGGDNEISDLGVAGAGTYMIIRGNTTSRVQLLHIYGSAGATTSYMEVGNYSKDNDTVSWVRALDNSDSNYGIASTSDSYHHIHFAKVGRLVVCTILPSALSSTLIGEKTNTIPAGYIPKKNETFTYFSDTAKNKGDSTGKVQIIARSDGSLYFGASHQCTVAETSRTLCWITA